MKLLLVNDDGIDAPGIAALEDAVSPLGDATVVAPEEHLSGCSHQATTHRPLAVRTIGERRHAVDGTPADCTRLGLLHLQPDVDLVVAGINDGANLGADIYLSGTLAAVREAALLGRVGIAFSQYKRPGEPVDWQWSSAMVSEVIADISRKPRIEGTYWNVNLPAGGAQSSLPPVVHCRPDRHPLPVRFECRDGRYEYRGDYHLRKKHPGTDVDVCFSGRIAVSHLKLGADH